MTSIRRPWKLLAAVFTVVGLSLATASPVAAGLYATVFTTDDNPGGANQWVPDGDKFHVCDRQADGMRVWGRGWVRLADGSWNLLGTREDASGSDGTCSIWNEHDVIEGRQIRLRVCLKNGPDGNHLFCAESTQGEA